MKYFAIVLFSSLMLAACSSSKMVSMDPVQFEQCTQQSDLTGTDVYTGETVDNVIINQQTGLVYVTMDVRTYCNSALSMDVKQDANKIMLMLSNTNTGTDNCVCVKKARTALRDLAPGTYNLQITDKTGYRLLHQESVTIPE